MTRVSELYYEQLGDQFDQFMSDYDVAQRKRLIQKLLEGVSLHGRALEVGCGTGKLSPLLLVPGVELTVGDISEQLCRTVATRLGCSSRPLDACQLPFEDQSVDIILSSEVIEHTPNPTRALQEMARVLAPGGTLIVTSPNKLWYPVLWLSMKLGIRQFQGNEIWLWPSRAAAILRDAGLSIERVSGCHLFPWQIPGAKRVLPFFDRLGNLLYPLMINFAVRASKPKDFKSR